MYEVSLEKVELKIHSFRIKMNVVYDSSQYDQYQSLTIQFYNLTKNFVI